MIGLFHDRSERLVELALRVVGSTEYSKRFAARIPSARMGSIEVRPIMKMG